MGSWSMSPSRVASAHPHQGRIVTSIEVTEGRPIHTGWRFQEFYWGQVHGWLDEATQRAAFVAAGPDSWDRAQALLATRAGHLVCDETAWEWRDADRRRSITRPEEDP